MPDSPTSASMMACAVNVIRGAERGVLGMVEEEATKLSRARKAM